ncbi:MAG: hypothetical protein IT202_05325 [Fimbriimonadaceae bacterium]|nr:hypothetical protein [Fimbriimonadaceae bacterium]
MSKAFYEEFPGPPNFDFLSDSDNLPWPRSGQKLLKGPTESTPSQARAVIHWLNTEHGMDMKAETFATAGHLLVEAVIRGADGTHPDRFVFPILYLYRHALEIELKETIRYGLRFNLVAPGKATDKLLGSHSLLPLWEIAKPVIATLPGPPEDLEYAEGLLIEMHRADPDGQSLRYHRNRHGEANVVELPGVIDLINLRTVFQGLWAFLGASNGMISDWEVGY